MITSSDPALSEQCLAVGPQFEEQNFFAALCRAWCTIFLFSDAAPIASMTMNEIETAFCAAASDFNDSLSFMQPYRRGGSEGYCEANIVEYFSHALRQIGFRPFLELPITRGRVDALFFQGSTFLLLEAKQFYRESVAYVQADLARLTTINVSALLNAYGFAGSVSQVIHIAVCDCWSDLVWNAWTANPAIQPFLSGYTTRAVVVPNGSAINQPYSWLLAYR